MDEETSEHGGPSRKEKDKEDQKKDHEPKHAQGQLEPLRGIDPLG